MRPAPTLCWKPPYQNAVTSSCSYVLCGHLCKCCFAAWRAAVASQGSGEDQEEMGTVWKRESGEWHSGMGTVGGKGTAGRDLAACLLVAELSLAPCCWLLFAPRSKTQHLWKIIHWRKEDREVKKRRRLGPYRRMLPKFPRWMNSHLGNTSTHGGISWCHSQRAEKPSILLGCSYSLWQQVLVMADITEMQLHLSTFLSNLLGEEHPQGRAHRLSCRPM